MRFLMKLSFVIPAHNEERLIVQCLESIVREVERSGCEADIIVVDNGSVDATSKRARSVSGVRVVPEPRLGLSQARQTGFAASTGDLIANIDADIILPEGWVDTVLTTFDGNERVVALSGPHIFYDLSWWSNLWVRAFYLSGFVSHVFGQYVLRRSAMLQGGNFVLRRSALEQIGGFDTKIQFYGEDTDIARRIMRTGRVMFLFQLPAFTSGRRLKKEGVVRTGIRYTVNYVWIILFRKPFSKKYRVMEEGTISDMEQETA